MPVTLKDIAREVGVSHQLVSFALNGHPHVAPATRERIQQAARKMGYSKSSNRAARALAARRHGKTVRTGTIGYSLTLPQLDRLTPYYTLLQAGIQEEGHRAGFDVLMLNPNSTEGWEKVDGIVGHGITTKSIARVSAVPIPLVSLMSAGKNGFGVVADEYSGMEQAVRHLVELGHRRIAFLVDTHVPHPQIDSRVAGYQQALRDTGIEPDNRWLGVLRIDDTEFLQRGRDSMREWLARDWSTLGCTALLVQNDRAAMGAMEVLREAKIRVPADVSVIGFDSTEECELCHPRLTSVRLPLREMGARAAALLIEQLRSEEAKPRIERFETRLDMRNSTAPPAA